MKTPRTTGPNDRLSVQGFELVKDESLSVDLRAAAFAERAHLGQTYGEGVPYLYHLNSVVDVLIDYGIEDRQMWAAAWLHDSVEDTDTSIETVQAQFGLRIASLVAAVTNGPGKNRREKHAVTYPVIRNTPGATLLKLADRIANVRCSAASTGSSKLKMYQKEHLEFREALYVPGEYEAMWAELDSLLAVKSPLVIRVILTPLKEGRWKAVPADEHGFAGTASTIDIALQCLRSCMRDQFDSKIDDAIFTLQFVED